MKSVGFTMTAVLPVYAAQAQEAPSRPDSLPSREQVQQPAPDIVPPMQPQVRIDAEQIRRSAPCPFDQSDVRVAISRVRFAGPSGEAIPAPIASVLDGIGAGDTSDQPIDAVCRIRDLANDALHRSGFIATVQIPPQTVSDGELLLTVITARITGFRVRGDTQDDLGHYRSTLLARMDRLRALDPLSERDVQRILLLASDVPGLEVQLSLRPAGTAPGDVIGDLEIVRRRFAVLANAQNYGSRQIGRENAYVRAESYGLLTATDIVYAGASISRQTREQQVVQGGYTTGIGHDGTTIGIRSNYAWSRPDLGPLDLRSQSLVAGIDLTHPLLRSVDTNLIAGAGIELIEQRTRVHGGGGSVPLNLDKLRVAYLRLSSNARLRGMDGRDIASLTAGLELRQGLAIADANRRGEVETGNGYTPSRFDADPQATVLRGGAGMVLHAGPFSVSSDARLQWTGSPLLNFEETAVGNLTVGRGYDPGANSGDRFYGFANEVRANLPLLDCIPTQVFGLADIAWLRNLDEDTTEARRRLRSVGGGMRLTLPGRLLVEAMYAKPLDRALSFDRSRPPGRLLLSITAQFAPRKSS